MIFAAARAPFNGESIKQPQAAYFGCDINYQSTMIAKMCADLLDEEISIECCDVFQFAENANYPKADKIFPTTRLV